MKQERWISWSQWEGGVLIGSGQMPESKISYWLKKDAERARSLQKETGADHVVYGMKMFDKNGRIESVSFHMVEMTDEEFNRRAALLIDVEIYAVHKNAA